MNEKREGTGRRMTDKCTCRSPFRYREKDIDNSIDTHKDEIKTIFGLLGGKMSVKMFSIIMTLLMGVFIAVFAASHTTNSKTLDLVIKINEDVVEIRAQQSLINKLLPNNITVLTGVGP